MVSNRDDVHTPACRFHRPCGADLRLHPNRSLGWRWADLVRGRSAYTPLRYRHSRDGWNLSSRASLPRRRSHCSTRSSCRIARQGWRCATHRSRHRGRTGYAMQVSWFGRRQSHFRILHFAPIGRYFLRDGARWLCSKMGSLLERSSLPVKDDTEEKSLACAIENWMLTALVAGSFVVGIISAVKYLLK